MSEPQKDPFEQSYQVALYKSLKYGWTTAQMFYGERDTEYHGDYVRISEPMEVHFTQLQTDQAIQNALATLDSQEREARGELEKRLSAIRTQRNNLLALTHQPSEAAL